MNKTEFDAMDGSSKRKRFMNEVRQLGNELENAISERDYLRVCAIERRRRDVLHSFATKVSPGEDQVLMEMVENLAEEVAGHISNLTAQIVDFNREVTDKRKIIEGYNAELKSRGAL